LEHRPSSRRPLSVEAWPRLPALGGSCWRCRPATRRCDSPDEELGQHVACVSLVGDRRCLCLTVLAACRPQEPPPLVAEDLGTAEQPLLPDLQPLPVRDRAALEGKATPIEATEAAIERRRRGRTRGRTRRGPAGEVRRALREMGGQALKAVEEERFVDLADGDRARPAGDGAKAAGRAGQAGHRRREADAIVKEKAPNLVQSIGAMTMPGLPAGFGSGGAAGADQLAQLIELGDVRFDGAERAVATLQVAKQPLPVELWLVRDEWYIHLPPALEDAELVDAILQLMGAFEEKLSGSRPDLRMEFGARSSPAGGDAGYAGTHAGDDADCPKLQQAFGGQPGQEPSAEEGAAPAGGEPGGRPPDEAGGPKDQPEPAPPSGRSRGGG